MTDIEKELKNLNDNATLLLTKYDGVFSKLSEESQKILLSMKTQGQAVLDDISEMLASGNVAQAENALKLGGKALSDLRIPDELVIFRVGATVVIRNATDGISSVERLEQSKYRIHFAEPQPTKYMGVLISGGNFNNFINLWDIEPTSVDYIDIGNYEYNGSATDQASHITVAIFKGDFK